MLRNIFTIIFLCNSLSLIASDKDLYDFLWLDQDKKVFVLQNKLYEKKNSFYTDIGLTGSLTGAFQDTIGFKAYAGYFLSEEWSIEFLYGQYSNSDNEAIEIVRSKSDVDAFIRRPIAITSIFINWTPFYGKINTFNKIFYFDFSMGLGTGIYKMESNVDSVVLEKEVSTFVSETYNPLQLKLEMKFHANERMHLGVEYMSNFISAETPNSRPNKSIKQFSEYTLKVGISF